MNFRVGGQIPLSDFNQVINHVIGLDFPSCDQIKTSLIIMLYIKEQVSWMPTEKINLNKKRYKKL